MNGAGLFSDLMQHLGGDATAPSSAAARTLDALRRRIISLDLPPDTVLSRSELAREYDVSQTPVRDALQRLEAEGLVEIFPQSRTVVTRIDADKIAEAVFLRRAIEVEVMRQLAPVIDDALLSRLRTIVEMQRALAHKREELGTFHELDETFHQTMIAAVGFPGLHRLIRSRSGHLNRVRRLNMWDDTKIGRIIDDHTGVIAGLETRDPDKAEAAIRKHLGQTIATLDTLRAQHGAYFKD
ncbi:GntR family transcriptional regulator [Salipiger sp.]|uniref:GntR family transcriptional regulator n=2 Tax=Salipiger sp. TaxID=2078585 RepID=UPI003A971075